MISNRVNVLCRYHYDPLDRLIGASPLSDFELKRFYCKSRLVTEIQGVVQRSIVQQADQLLAQHERKGNAVATSLLVTDRMRSVLESTGVQPSQLISYSPYGHRYSENGLLSLLGFNGERPDSITEHYLLGNGYRAFNTVLMRFNSPDVVSPFSAGGINSYVYCGGDPINRYDETGHAWSSGIGSSLSKVYKRIVKAFGSSSYETVGVNNLSAAKAGVESPKILKNTMPEALNGEKSTHALLLRIGGVEKNDYGIRKVTNIEELRLATTWKYAAEYPTKFILTDKKDIVVGKIFHSVLSDAAGDSNVISAGHIRRRASNEWEIKNTSGHYRPEYESLSPMKSTLEGMGAKVKLLRHQ